MLSRLFCVCVFICIEVFLFLVFCFVFETLWSSDGSKQFPRGERERENKKTVGEGERYLNVVWFVYSLCRLSLKALLKGKNKTDALAIPAHMLQYRQERDARHLFPF